MNLVPFLVSLTMTISWGVTWFLSARASKKLGAIHSLFLFQLVGIPLLLPIFPFVHPHVPAINFVYIILLGIWITIGMIAFFYATKVGDISIVNPISDTYLLILVVLGILFLHETFSFQKIAAIVMVFAGTILLGADLKALAKGFRVKLFEGVGAALFSALSASLGFFFVAIVSRQGNWFYTTIGIRVTISFFTFLLLIYKKQTVKKMFTDIPWRFVIPAAFLDVAAFALYTFASSKFEVSYIAAFVSSQSLVGVLLAHIILKEKLEKYQYIGLPLIIGGLVLLNLFV